MGSELTFYTYDVEDRLVKVEDSMVATIAEYYYDPFGRRLWKEVEGVRTYFVYSNEGLIAELDNTGNEIKSYGYMPDSQWGTAPLFVRIAGQYYWYRNDAQGTPQKIVDTSGRVVWAAVYDSFGNGQVIIEEITNNLRFAGQYFDQETGLHYNLNRYYDPKLGRYLRTDTFGDGLNLYAYCFNNPNSWIDPEGLCAKNWITGEANQLWDLFWYDWFFDIGDFVAGFGDIITLGGTKSIREMWYRNVWCWKDDHTKYRSTAYGAGGLSGGLVGTTIASYYLATKLKPTKLIPTFIGATTNAIVNYSSWRGGDLTHIQYARSIASGAAIGLSTSYAKGIIQNTIIGGGGSGLNTLLNQIISGSNVDLGKKMLLLPGLWSDFLEVRVLR